MFPSHTYTISKVDSFSEFRFSLLSEYNVDDVMAIADGDDLRHQPDTW